ncbi:hypothetical protein FDZ71_10490 [bacterium]|nr:MAG: hypothetical protein FDZ71_10490 [bacterium]
MNILDEMRDKGWISLFMKNWLVFESPEDMLAYIVSVARKGGFVELSPLIDLERRVAAESGSNTDIVASVRELLADSFGPLSPKGPYTYRTLASSWELSAAFEEYCAGQILPSQEFCGDHKTSFDFLTCTFGEAKINP